MFKLFSLISLLILVNQSKSSEKADRYLKQFNHLVISYQKCSALRTSHEFYSCVKEKLLVTLDEIAQYDEDIELIPGYLELVTDEEEDSSIERNFEKEHAEENNVESNDIRKTLSRKHFVAEQTHESKVEENVDSRIPNSEVSEQNKIENGHQQMKDFEHIKANTVNDNMWKKMNISNYFADLQNDVSDEVLKNIEPMKKTSQNKEQ